MRIGRNKKPLEDRAFSVIVDDSTADSILSAVKSESQRTGDKVTRSDILRTLIRMGLREFRRAASEVP
jgi:hypothetical protein